MFVFPRKKSPVYTRTGDQGTSSLYNLQREEKDSKYFMALGDTDELNANLGLVRELCQKETLRELDDRLVLIQSRLLDIGSAIATPLTR